MTPALGGKAGAAYTSGRILNSGSWCKGVKWVGSSRLDLKEFPKAVQRKVGQALYAAQCGEEYPTVKALHGFGGRSILEIAADYKSDTWRVVYTTRLGG